MKRLFAAALFLMLLVAPIVSSGQTPAPAGRGQTSPVPAAPLESGRYTTQTTQVPDAQGRSLGVLWVTDSATGKVAGYTASIVSNQNGSSISMVKLNGSAF